MAIILYDQNSFNLQKVIFSFRAISSSKNGEKRKAPSCSKTVMSCKLFYCNNFSQFNLIVYHLLVFVPFFRQIDLFLLFRRRAISCLRFYSCCLYCLLSLPRLLCFIFIWFSNFLISDWYLTGMKTSLPSLLLQRTLILQLLVFVI